SALLAFIVTNIYYHFYLKPENDKKITNIAENSVAIYEENDDRSADDYFSTLTDLGYQFYMVDQEGNSTMYGVPLRSYELPSEEIERVLNGEIYHGIANYPWKLFVIGFFNNKLSNTVGVPFEDRKSTRLNSSHVSISYAVFCLKKKTQRNMRCPLLIAYYKI